MRVERILKPPGLGAYIPKHKSMTDGSVVHRCFLDGEAARGWEDVELGGLTGRFFVEAVPFAADGQRRVMSLIHLDGGPEGSPV